MITNLSGQVETDELPAVDANDHGAGINAKQPADRITTYFKGAREELKVIAAKYNPTAPQMSVLQHLASWAFYKPENPDDFGWVESEQTSNKAIAEVTRLSSRAIDDVLAYWRGLGILETVRQNYSNGRYGSMPRAVRLLFLLGGPDTPGDDSSLIPNTHLLRSSTHLMRVPMGEELEKNNDDAADHPPGKDRQAADSASAEVAVQGIPDSVITEAAESAIRPINELQWIKQPVVLRLFIKSAREAFDGQEISTWRKSLAGLPWDKRTDPEDDQYSDSWTDVKVLEEVLYLAYWAGYDRIKGTVTSPRDDGKKPNPAGYLTTVLPDLVQGIMTSQKWLEEVWRKVYISAISVST